MNEKKERFNKAVKLCAKSPVLVAKRILKAGVYDETAVYLFCQKLYNAVLKVNEESAEIFAKKLEEEGIKLACRRK